MIIQRYCFCLLAISVCFFMASAGASAQVKKVASPPSPSAISQNALEFQVSVRDAGFMGWTAGGFMSGMLERGFAIDGLQVRMTSPYGGVWYAVCTDDGVWQSWVSKGETAGALNQKNIHAIALRLYDMPGAGVAYRVHSTGGEWQEWVKNGAAAGIKGKTIDAVEIRIEPSDAPPSALSSTNPPPMLTADTPMQGATTPPGGITKTTTPETAVSTPAPQKIESFTVQDTPPPVTKASAPPAVQKSSMPPSNATLPSTTLPGNQNTANQQNSGGQPQSQGNAQGNTQAPSWNPQGNIPNGNNQGAYSGGNSQGNTPNWNTQTGQFNTNNPPNQPTGQSWSQWTHQPMQRAQGFETSAQPVFVPISSRRIVLAAHNGYYVTAGNDAEQGAIFAAFGLNIGTTELFDMAFVGEHRVALRTPNGRYLNFQRTMSGGGAALRATNDAIGTAEIFDIMAAGQDRIAFRAANGQYLSVSERGGYRLGLKEGLAGQWESFLILRPDGKPLLDEASGNGIWRSQNNGSQTVVVDQQGRIVESADRVLMLVSNPATTNAPASGSAPNAAVPNTSASANTSTKAASTVNPATYLAPIELDIIQELNFARTKPGEYATLLEGYRRYYKGKAFAVPGQRSITTKEGVKALDEVILTLRMTRPLEALTTSQALSKAARDHVDNAGAKGIIGHVGTDKSNPNDRAARYGKGVVSENCGYNRTTAREIVVRLLIDDGTADRGYRKNILNPAFKLVGMAFGLHKSQQTMCSQVFAADFVEK